MTLEARQPASVLPGRPGSKVNPTDATVETVIRIDGDLTPKTATMQLVAPGGETVKNSLEQPDNIKVVAGTATVDNRTVQFTMPPLSVGVVRVTP